MPVRSLTAPSIGEALAEARSVWGSGVVLLESVPASENAPARISVMVDRAPVAEPAASVGRGWTVDDSTPAEAPRRRPKLTKDPVPASIRPVPEFRKSGALFQDEAPADPLTRFETLLPRLNRSEDAHDRISGRLLRMGLPERVAQSLARQVSLDERPEPEALQSALAAVLPPAAPLAPTLVVTGPTAELATRFVLRYALHLLQETGRALPPLVVIVRPVNAEAIGWLDPRPLYRQHGLPVHLMTSAQEGMPQRAARFEGLLIDAGTHPAAGLLDGAQHVHVVDSQRRIDDAAAQSDAVAVANETSNWMKAAGLLLEMARPVAALLCNPEIHGSLKAYRPASVAAAALEVSR